MLTPAPATALSITPKMSSVALLRRRTEAMRISSRAPADPNQADAANEKGEISTPLPTANMASAAPKLAPELMPST